MTWFCHISNDSLHEIISNNCTMSLHSLLHCTMSITSQVVAFIATYNPTSNTTTSYGRLTEVWGPSSEADLRDASANQKRELNKPRPHPWWTSLSDWIIKSHVTHVQSGPCLMCWGQQSHMNTQITLFVSNNVEGTYWQIAGEHTCCASNVLYVCMQYTIYWN